MPRTMKTRRPALTVAEAVRKNGNSRHGLGGLRMIHVPTGRKFVCKGSTWGAGQTLMLLVSSKVHQPRPPDGPEDRSRPASLADVRTSVTESLRADECVLLDPWKPRRSRI